MQIKIKLLVCIIGTLIFLPIKVTSQTSKSDKFTISGTVYEVLEDGKKVPLPYATVSIIEYGVGISTNDDGKYSISNLLPGNISLDVQFLGKQPIHKVISLNKDMVLDFTLEEDNFRIKEIVVTAETTHSGQSTASKISRTAMDHLQATSLDDVLSLLPGGITTNPTLNHSKQINIRTNVNEQINSMGSAIISDGAPVSNNANLQSMNPAVTGGTASLGGTASPSGGIDVRGISIENIESVEVIRGIPSVQYGDLTAGAIILNSKAGKEPLRINAKTNPNLYQISAGKGVDLGKNRGALNVSGDYAYNVNDVVQSYIHYTRFNSKLMYSNTFLKNKLRSNTSLNLIYGKNERERNPDDELTKTSSSGKDLGFTFNTNGLFNINKGWLTNIQYVASASYTSKKSFHEQLYTAANAPYSMTTTDGTILSNKAGRDIFDESGNKLTNFSGKDADYYAIYLPNSYFSRYDIDGKEINFFGKLSSNLFKRIGNTNNKILLGIDFKIDGNRGDGKTFNHETPPYRSLQAVNASFRQRAYKDIPFIKQMGLFAEENMNFQFGERFLNIQAGVRYDNISHSEDAVSPRLNLSVDVIPNTLTLRGGYGMTAKAPTALYLFPENAYFEYVNINETSNESIPEEERVFMTTTRVFNTQNSNLKVMKNKKVEIGFDLKLGQPTLSVVAFSEKLNNGYGMTQVFKPLMYNEYVRSSNDNTKFTLSESNPVLASYFVPNNNRSLNSKGVEFDLNLGRIDAIRTSFIINGAWTQSESFNNDYTYFDDYSGTGGANRTHIGLYEKGMKKSYYENFVTTLRATHNIPDIGFVITLTAQTIWKESDWNVFGNDTIPVKYISKFDGQIYNFDPAKKNEDEFKTLLRHREDRLYIGESYPPLFCFNINLTKEIGDFLRVSFFANNMFRSYPVVESKRSPGNYIKRNNNFFYGLELSLKL